MGFNFSSNEIVVFYARTIHLQLTFIIETFQNSQ